MNKTLPALVLAALALASCRTGGSTGAALRDAAPVDPSAFTITFAEHPADIPALTCATGQPSLFTLSAPQPPVTTAQVPLLPEMFSTTPTEPSPAGPSGNVRFDVCVDDGADPAVVTLKRLVLLGVLKIGVGKYEVITFNSPQPDPELAKLVFQDASTYALRIGLQHMADNFRVLDFLLDLKVWPAAGQQVVSAEEFMHTVPLDSSPAPADSTLANAVGTLGLGNPVVDAAAMECGDAPATIRKFKIETATFTARMCTNFIGTAGTNNYEFRSIAVSDDSPDVPADVRGKSFELKDAAFAQNFKNKLVHHNVCDSFALHLPHATYSATAAPFGETVQGCPASVVVADAPTRDAADQSQSFYFRAKYGAAPAKVYREPCGRAYFLDCQGTLLP